MNCFFLSLLLICWSSMQSSMVLYCNDITFIHFPYAVIQILGSVSSSILLIITCYRLMNEMLLETSPNIYITNKWKVCRNNIICILRFQLHSLYHSPNIIRMIKPRKLQWAGHVAGMDEGRSAFKILTGKPTRKRPLGRPRHWWKDNIRIDI